MAPKSWTIQELLKVTAEYLAKKQIESSRLCAEILLAHQLQTNRLKLYLEFERPLQEEEIEGYRALIVRRVNREPVQYITGHQEFWSMDLRVNPSVLIPRPETEVLVEQAIYLIQNEKIPVKETYHLLDLGTGSGALALALAKELEKARVWATDISGTALETARANARQLGLENRIEFREGDLWEPVQKEQIGFDLIVSNPPYIAEEQYAGLAPEVKDHEPGIALNGGAGGMCYLEKIAARASEFLNPEAWLLLEMDPAQTGPVMDLLQAGGRFESPRCVKDYSGQLRVVMA
ncbi:MAG: peptide chain release factor N(5)-glutamine methyltransferase, partial [Desulfobacteraceae bacterium]